MPVEVKSNPFFSIFILGGYGRAGNFSSTSVDSPATSSSGGDSPAPSTHRSQGGGGGVSSLTAAEGCQTTSSFFPGMAGGSESPSSELVSNGYQHMGPDQTFKGMSFRYKKARMFFRWWKHCFSYCTVAGLFFGHFQQQNPSRVGKNLEFFSNTFKF